MFESGFKTLAVILVSDFYFLFENTSSPTLFQYLWCFFPPEYHQCRITEFCTWCCDCCIPAAGSGKAGEASQKVIRIQHANSPFQFRLSYFYCWFIAWWLVKHNCSTGFLLPVWIGHIEEKMGTWVIMLNCISWHHLCVHTTTWNTYKDFYLVLHRC